MNKYQYYIVRDAIGFANMLRLPENAEALKLFIELGKSDDEVNQKQSDASALLSYLEYECDTASHSGASWAYAKAYTRVILGLNRTYMYMNWINEAEGMMPGCTEPLSALDLETNKKPVQTSDNSYVIYNPETKTYIPYVG
jgi:hypothetical protein